MTILEIGVAAAVTLGLYNFVQGWKLYRDYLILVEHHNHLVVTLSEFFKQVHEDAMRDDQELWDELMGVIEEEERNREKDDA